MDLGQQMYPNFLLKLSSRTLLDLPIPDTWEWVSLTDTLGRLRGDVLLHVNHGTLAVSSLELGSRS